MAGRNDDERKGDAEAAYAATLSDFENMARCHLRSRQKHRAIVNLLILQRPGIHQSSRPTEVEQKEQWPGLCSSLQPRLCMLRVPTQPGGTSSKSTSPPTPERSDEEELHIDETAKQTSPRHRRTEVADGPYGAEIGPDPLTYRESADITRAILDEENEGDFGDYRPIGRGAETYATKLFELLLSKNKK